MTSHTQPMSVTERVKSLLSAYKCISLEPIFFLFWTSLSLTYVSTQDLYLAKACKVNLNYTEALCDNIHQHGDVQQETQKYVSGVQAYNGLLQSAPTVIFTLFAGPLTDKYGRKPLILVSMTGYLILDIVMLVNSIWFYQLKVISFLVGKYQLGFVLRLSFCWWSVYKT